MKNFQWLLIGLSLAFLGLIVLVKTNPSLALDLSITRTIQSINIPYFDWLMKFLTLLGFQQGIVFLVSVTAGGFYFHRQKKEAFLVIFSTVGAILISETFKQIVGRPRPDGTLINQVGQYLGHDSFPSGHVLFYIGFFGYLLYLSYIKIKPGPLRNTAITSFASLIFLIGVSRIYLGAHWFSDVLGSYLIGTVWLFIVIRLHHNLKGRLK